MARLLTVGSPRLCLCDSCPPSPTAHCSRRCCLAAPVYVAIVYGVRCSGWWMACGVWWCMALFVGLVRLWLILVVSLVHATQPALHSLLPTSMFPEEAARWFAVAKEQVASSPPGDVRTVWAKFMVRGTRALACDGGRVNGQLCVAIA